MEPKEVSTGYDPNPRQREFHTAPHRYRFYGGAAGGGKTRALLEETLAQIAEAENAGVKLNAVYFRKTFPELESSAIKEFLDIVPTMGRNRVCRYNYSVHKAKFLGGSQLTFAHCASDNDVYKYQSAEYDLIAIDELTHFTEFQFKYLRSRLRTVGKGIFANMILASNPGGVGHAWVKRIFVDRKFEPEEMAEKDEYVFIPAKVYDNKILMERDPDYVKRLEALPEHQRRALLHGDWDIFEGQFFGEWRRDVHVCGPFEIPVGWLRYRSIDYGYRAPFSCHWYAVDYDGKVWCYRELYETERTAVENARKILEMSEGENYQYTTIDPSCFSRSHTGESIAEVLMREGVANLVKADNDRIGGWNSVREYLRVRKDGRGDRYANICIFDVCRNMVRTVPELQYDEHRMDDLDTRGEDHGADDLRYFLQTLRHRRSVVPKTGVELELQKMREAAESGDMSFRYDQNYI